MGASHAPDPSPSPAGLYTLSLPYRRLCIFTDLPSAAIGEFSGATIRGGLGYSLRNVVCNRPGMDCAGCERTSGCVFARCYGEQSSGPDVRPFTLFTQDDEGGICIVLTLFADAVTQTDIFLRAFQHFGIRGIGKQMQRFAVRKVTGTNEYGKINIFPGKSEYGEILIRFLSPLALKVGGTILDRFEPEVFLNMLFKRVVGLSALSGEMVPGTRAIPEIDDAIKTVRIKQSSIDHRRFDRFSTRQNRTIWCHGIQGKAVLDGDIGTLLPLLRAGEITGVGRGTTLGYGRYERREFRSQES